MTYLCTSGNISHKSVLQKAQEALENMWVPGSSRIAKTTGAFTTTDLTTGGGLLAPQQQSRFVQMLRIQPTLLKEVLLKPLKGPTDRIDRIGFTGRISHVGTENTALSTANRSEPTTSKVEMSPKRWMSECQISYDALQDSIEGGRRIRGNRMELLMHQLIGEQTALDIEEFALLSDTTSTDADLAQTDGFIKLAEDQNSYDHGGAAISKAFFKSTFLQLPKQYRQNKTKLRWVASSNMEIEWADELADRSTSNADPVAWGQKDVSHAYGIPMVISGYMPAESGSSSNLGKVLISHPNNMVVGFWLDVTMEVDRDIRTGTLIVVTRFRSDFNFQQVEGAAVGTNVKVA